MTLVWSKSRNKRTALLLELAIADFAHDNGRGAWPSVPTLAKKTRMSERNVQLLADKLVESGEVSIEEGGGPYGTNAYAINVKLLESLPDPEAEEEPIEGGEKFSPPGEESCAAGENARENDAENFTSPVKKRAEKTRGISPNPSGNPPMNHPLEPSTTATALVSPSEPKQSAAVADLSPMDAEAAHVRLVLERAGFRAPAPANAVKNSVSLLNAILWGYWVQSRKNSGFDNPHGFAVNQMTLDPRRAPEEHKALLPILREMLDDPDRFRCKTECAFCEREWELALDMLVATENITIAGYRKHQAQQLREQAERLANQRTPISETEARRQEEVERAQFETIMPLAEGKKSPIGYVWGATLSDLQLQMTKATFDAWLKQTSAIAYRAERDELVIGVPNDYAKQWLENRLCGMIERAAGQVIGRPVHLAFELETSMRVLP
jgi:hypothetical protein